MNTVELFLIHVCCGPLMLILTFIFMKFPPKKINSLYGYRTRRSMKNQDVWQTANTIALKLLFQASLVTTIFQGFGMILSNTDYILYSYIFLVITIGVSIWITEVRLNQLFDNKGNRLNKE